MADSDNLDPPKQSWEDDVHLFIKAAFSIIPFTGGVAAEVFTALITPPIQKRQYVWMENVTEVLRRLMTEKGLTLDSLQADDAFITVVLHATTVALRNHQEEKMQALKYCLFNAANTSDLMADLHLSFIRFVDELLPAHMILLRLIRERQGEIAALKSYDELYKVHAPGLPEGTSQDIYVMLCLDLESRGLIRISADIEDFPGIYEASALLLEETRDDLPRVAISTVGIEFLDFVSSSD
jgi:hypothetical protein